MQLFFCKIPGCAANVTKVFCNNELVIDRIDIADCTGAPPLMTVCQRDGRAFVSIDTDGDCEFEEKAGYIQTEKCTGIYFYFPKLSCDFLAIIYTVLKT